MKRRVLIALAGLLLFGALRLPFERQLSQQMRAANLLSWRLNFDVREQAGQMGFVAALSGFRAVVADFIWISAYDSWANTEWGRLKLKLDAATTLQPRAIPFWDNAAWHMAWNAAIAAREDKRQPRETLRLKAEREYIKLGEEFLLRGVGFNPDSATLYDRLGLLYTERMKDPCRSAWAYFESAKRPDAMGYVHRFAVYQLAKCPGHEKEALELLLQLYHRGPHERLPTLLKLIEKLQIQLNVPESERIDIREDLRQATPR